MKKEGSKIFFDKFATEDLWALSSLRAFLFDEYRITQDRDKLPVGVIYIEFKTNKINGLANKYTQ